MPTATNATRPPIDPRDIAGNSVTFPENEPLQLDCAQVLAPLTLAYQTYGSLNADKSNAILLSTPPTVTR
jgi:homoserine acetyltransferase